jgi:hypothetical protein
VGSPELRSHTGANRNESVAGESWVPVESPAKFVATPVTLGLGWYGGNEKKRHCQERDHRYTSHCCSPADSTAPDASVCQPGGRTCHFLGLCAVSLPAPSLSF